MRTFFIAITLLLLWSCTQERSTLPVPEAPARDTSAFIQYSIPAGAHFATHNPYKTIETDELRFTVRFDSSAIYQSRSVQNQDDINKLYGFSDNDSSHHQFSARFGWRWSNRSLQLLAYVYNNGVVTSEVLGPVRIGSEINCRIKVEKEAYAFHCNETVAKLPRQSTTAKGRGYLLYPYFGGDETAPHEIRIWIKSE